jgi:hypothetical protein
MTVSPTCQSNALEFVSLASRAGIDLSAMVDPRTELSFAVGCRICSTCTLKEKCRRALRQSNAPLSAVGSFCPCTDVLVELMYWQPGRRTGQVRVA